MAPRLIPTATCDLQCTPRSLAHRTTAFSDLGVDLRVKYQVAGSLDLLSETVALACSGSIPLPAAFDSTGRTWWEGVMTACACPVTWLVAGDRGKELRFGDDGWLMLRFRWRCRLGMVVEVEAEVTVVIEVKDRLLAGRHRWEVLKAFLGGNWVCTSSSSQHHVCCARSRLIDVHFIFHQMRILSQHALLIISVFEDARSERRSRIIGQLRMRRLRLHDKWWLTHYNGRLLFPSLIFTVCLQRDVQMRDNLVSLNDQNIVVVSSRGGLTLVSVFSLSWPSAGVMLRGTAMRGLTALWLLSVISWCTPFVFGGRFEASGSHRIDLSLVFLDYVHDRMLACTSLSGLMLISAA